MPDRQIDYGDGDAVYRSGDADADGGGNFVVVEDLDADVVLLEYDEADDQFVARGDVDLDGNDLIAVDALNTADLAGASEDEVLLKGSSGSDLTVGLLTTDSFDAAALAASPVERKINNIAKLEDGESIEIALQVPDGETLEVYRWGAFDAADGSAPDGLDVELLDDGDTVQESANTASDSDSSTPVADYENTSGSESIYKLRALNDTGSAIDDPGVASFFGWVIQ